MLLRQCWKAFRTVGCSLVLKYTSPAKHWDVYWMRKMPIGRGHSTTVLVMAWGAAAGLAGHSPDLGRTHS